ncbi:type IV secretion system DNA-binding domain-containing protein [Candidatus Kaiserbacteria bacterium]|nr:type IV secretion system DNA-binding domain-containing protein [Candidatus Kaiserbacteria bacterium]
MTQWTPDPERITFFAATHTRGKNTAFGIRAKDRDKHMYVIGKSGMGKSTLLENMAIQDIQNGEGMIFIDPHGSTAEKLLDFIPQDRIQDTMYVAPFDTDHPIGFNILEDVGYDNRHKVVAGLMGVFERIWADAWSARMQYILQNTLFALLEYPDATIIDVNRMLVNKAFREDVVSHVTDPIVAMFWKEEFAGYSDKYTQDATPAIQNKIGQFVSNPLIRNILGQAKSTFDFRTMMDERKIIIINLSKGRMGEANSQLLGSMFVIKIYLSALSRAGESASSIARLPNCYFYVDEFQNVTNKAFENILSESRKYKLCLTIANQYIEQMEEEVRNAVFGNVGTTIIFRVGPMDAQFLEPVFTPTFMPEDMVGLGRGDIYLTLMIDGVGSAPFSAHTLPPVDAPPHSYRGDVIYFTQHRYGRDRGQVEKEVKEAGEKWQEAAKQKHKDDSARGQKPGLKPVGSTFGTRPRPEPVQGMPMKEGDRFVGQKTVAAERTAPGSEHKPLLPEHHAKSPADILRTIHPKPQHQRPVESRPQPQPDVRNALKDAIASARSGNGSQQSGNARPQQGGLHAAKQFVAQPPRSHSAPQQQHAQPREVPKPQPQPSQHNPASSNVDPKELHEVLFGDDERA